MRLAQTGWKTGDEWDKAYDYLAEGNAEILNNLRQRFMTGPFDWEALTKQNQQQQPGAAAAKSQ